MRPAQNTFLFRELQVIQKIIEDETWLEGERRGCYVAPDDPAVREKVCLIVLRIGQQLRDSVNRSIASPEEIVSRGDAEPQSFEFVSPCLRASA